MKEESREVEEKDKGLFYPMTVCYPHAGVPAVSRRQVHRFLPRGVRGGG